jgi:DNA-binding GntR family transcriptional regulator
MARRQEIEVLDAALSMPTDRSTLAESVTSRLRELILDGQLPQGMPLRPTQLAPRLGVSVMPVREALRILGAEGLVAFTPRIGARVVELSEEDIEELYLSRGALEGLAARLAASRMTEEDLQGLRVALDEMLAAQTRQDLPAFMKWDREFHRRQFRASGRPQLVARILDLWDAGRLILPMTARTEHPMEAAILSHRAVLQAHEHRDPNAAEHVTRVHTEQAAERIIAARRRVRQVDGEDGRTRRAAKRGDRSSDRQYPRRQPSGGAATPNSG